MKKALLAVLLLAGCQDKGTKNLVIIGEDTIVLDGGGSIIISSVIVHDTVTIHDTLRINLKLPTENNVVTYGDNSPAIISDKPVNIKY